MTALPMVRTTPAPSATDAVPGLYECPHCGQLTDAQQKLPRLVRKLRRAYWNELKSDVLSETNMLILQRMLSSFPYPLGWEALAATIWRGAKEPSAPYGTTRSHVSQLNKKLEPIGWALRASRDAGYALRHVGERRMPYAKRVRPPYVPVAQRQSQERADG
jgi:hypothetical protein